MKHLKGILIRSFIISTIRNVGYTCLLFSLLLACERDEFYTSQSARLRFSTDTVLFDTVLNTIITPTKTLMVYNPYSKAMRISSISLDKGGQSLFKVNIDGNTSNIVNNMEIAANDSVFIFIQLTVPEQNSNTPVFIYDNLSFNFNGQTQTVPLRAWGQDVVILRNKHLTTQTLTSNKPYLVYDTLCVDSGQIVTMQAGTRLYFHNNALLLVKGSIAAMGELNKPIIMGCDRFDNLYSNVPYNIVGAQWQGIVFTSGTQDNTFNYTIIRNAITAINIENEGLKVNPKFEISNTQILHNSFAGILAKNSKIKMYNTIIANSSSYLLKIEGGGSYDLYHCTLANYSELLNRDAETFYASNNYNTLSKDLNIYVANSIISSAISGNEFVLDDNKKSTFNFTFQNCFIQTNLKDIDTTNTHDFIKSIYKTSGQKLFNSNRNYTYNFEPDSLSIIENRGNDSIAQLFPTDIMGNSRTSKPDLGAIERIIR